MLLDKKRPDEDEAGVRSGKDRRNERRALLEMIDNTRLMIYCMLGSTNLLLLGEKFPRFP